jgi:hypothetical protein
VQKTEQKKKRVAGAGAGIRAAFRDINAQLEGMSEGKLRVPGLGTFHVRMVAGQSGKKTAPSGGEGGAALVRRIVFRPQGSARVAGRGKAPAPEKG